MHRAGWQAVDADKTAVRILFPSGLEVTIRISELGQHVEAVKSVIGALGGRVVVTRPPSATADRLDESGDPPARPPKRQARKRGVRRNKARHSR